MSYEGIFIQKEINVTKKQEIKASNSNLVAKISDVDFSVRTLNSLKNENVIYLGDLVCYTEFEIKKFRNMGKKSIDEIKAKLTDFNLYLGMELNDWPPNDINNSFEQINYEKKIINQKIQETSLIELIKNLDETTLSLRAKNALRNLYCNYVGDILLVSKAALFGIPNLGLKSINEIEDYINSLNYNFGDKIVPWDEKIVNSLRKNLLEKISSKQKDELIANDRYLEIEISRILRESITSSGREEISNRIIDVLTNRFGLDGSPSKTLEIIGQKYNVTRERIRQNQAFGLRKLKIKRPFTPILDKVFETLLSYLPISENELNKILKEKNLTKQNWDFKGLKYFYESFGTRLNFYVFKKFNMNMISNEDLNKSFNQIYVKTSKIISNSGICSMSDCMKFKEVYSNNIKFETVKKLIQSKPLFAWLDEKQEWFTFYSNRNRLSNLITKAATVSKNLDLENLFNKIKSHHRLENVKYNKDVFISFCKNSFECKISNTDIFFDSPKSKLSDYDGYQGNIIAPNEQKVINIFKEFGPILSWWDLNELAKKADVSEASLTMMLQFSVIFKRIDRATYILNGEMLNSKEKKFIKIELTTDTFNKRDCPHASNKGQYYVEVYKSKKYIKTIAYPQTLRIIDQEDMGILYENKVYPIITDL